MKKPFFNTYILSKVFLLSVIFIFTSCEEKVTYGWGDINKSLGLLQEVREDLKNEISNLEDEGYDASELEIIDNRLKKVESILDKQFY